MTNVFDDFRAIPFSKLPSKYKKLFKRICNFNSSRTNKIPENVGGILDLDLKYFNSLPAVGKKYVHLLAQLQRELTERMDYSLTSLKENKFEIHPRFCIIPSALSNLHLNYQSLSDSEIKSLEKLERFFGAISAKDIIELEENDLNRTKGIGKSYSNSLISLQARITSELINIAGNHSNLSIFDSELLVSSEIKFYSMSVIEKYLLDDIEKYLWSLSDLQQYIALSRWGYNHKTKTLEGIAKEYGCTRERVRQLEQQNNEKLLLSIRIHPEVLWANLQGSLNDDLTQCLPHLYKCFESEKTFLNFLELCCHKKKGSINEGSIPLTNSPLKNKRILDPYFCVTPSPVPKHAVLVELTSYFGYTSALAEMTVNKMIKLGVIKSEHDGIVPQNLRQKEAIAHVLVSHPEGLPWKDIAKIANKLGIAKHINAERSTHGFNDSEYIYLCSHGHYRHKKFLDINEFDLDSILLHLLEYFELNKITAINLHDFFQQTKNERPEIEYFTLRHIVKEYGGAVGVIFNGRSGVDHVSIFENCERVTQRKVIVQALSRAKGAMTIYEIAEVIRSKSMQHAHYYLQELIKEEKVVHIDRTMYTTPEKAFENVNVSEIMGLIMKLMHSTNKIIETDIIKEHINTRLNLSYPKDFYSALIGINIGKYNFHRARNLFSDRPLKYKNLQQVCCEVCFEEATKSENIKRISEIVWLTKAAAERALISWKISNIP